MRTKLGGMETPVEEEMWQNGEPTITKMMSQTLTKNNIILEDIWLEVISILIHDLTDKNFMKTI